MSSNTKMILAIVLGSVGLLLGVLGTVTAYNAKDAVDSEGRSSGELQALVDERFREAQDKQDQIEAAQKSDAEQFVEQLTKDEKNVLRKINNNQKSIKQLKRKNRKLEQRVSTLQDRDRQLGSEIDQVEANLSRNVKQLNQKISRLNNQVQQLQREVANLQGRVG